MKVQPEIRGNAHPINPHEGLAELHNIADQLEMAGHYYSPRNAKMADILLSATMFINVALYAIEHPEEARAMAERYYRGPR